MKAIFRALSAVAAFAIFSNAFAESYVLTSKPAAVSFKATLQGAGSLLLNDKSIAKLLHLDPAQSSAIHMVLNLNSDHTLTGYIDTDALFYLPSQVVLNISGTWDRPDNGKVIYIAPDGDPTKGEAADGAYGYLFNPGMAAFIPVQNLMPMVFRKKVSGVSPIYSSIKFTKGVIKLKLDANGDITSAATDIRFAGRAMTTYCKLDEFKMCTITKGVKDAGFSAALKAQSTVVTTL